MRRLGPRPFDLLLFLCAEPGRVWTRAELMSSVWGRVIVSDETLSRCISDQTVALGSWCGSTARGPATRMATR